MCSRELTPDWRHKVNPIFTATIQVLRVIPRIARQLAQGQLQLDTRIRTVLVNTCEETMLLLPPGPIDPQSTQNTWVEDLATQPQNKWLADPEVRKGLAQIASRIEKAPGSLIKKGLARPHWWMAQVTWTEFVQKELVSESILNALALLQLNLPLHDLTKRIAEGDSRLYEKLFRPNVKSAKDGEFRLENTVEGVLQPLGDYATKIVGRALLLKGEPPGYQLPLRMTLFFGWDFGLCDLSARELHRFLVEMNVVPISYDPETLRKYRNRLRRTIERTSRPRLAEAGELTTQKSSC